MNKIIFNTFLSSLILLIFSCARKDELCKNKQDTIAGIITQELGVDCIPDYGKSFIINDDSTYKSLFTSNCNLPEIDFSTHTILGLYASGNCNVQMNKKVIKNETIKEYQYTVTVKSCGNCESLGLGYNWVVVPKLPLGWDVSFMVIKN